MSSETVPSKSNVSTIIANATVKPSVVPTNSVESLLEGDKGQLSTISLGTPKTEASSKAVSIDVTLPIETADKAKTTSENKTTPYFKIVLNEGSILSRKELKLGVFLVFCN